VWLGYIGSESRLVKLGWVRMGYDSIGLVSQVGLGWVGVEVEVEVRLGQVRSGWVWLGQVRLS
jgi:hypothetical protein